MVCIWKKHTICEIIFYMSYVIIKFMDFLSEFRANVDKIFIKISWYGFFVRYMSIIHNDFI